MRNNKFIRGLVTAHWIGLVTLLAAGPIAQAQSPASAPAVTALHCGHLLDPVAGKLLGATTIVVAGKRVQEVQSGTTTSTSDFDLCLVPSAIRRDVLSWD